MREVLSSFGSYPRYFLRLREVNRRGPSVYGSQLPTLPDRAPDEVRRLVDAGAELIDVRRVRSLCCRYVRGTLLDRASRPAFASWLGWLVPDDRPLVFVLDRDQDRDELVRQCLKIGYEDLAGELAGGMTAWRAAGLKESSIALARDAPSDRPILDVRSGASSHPVTYPAPSTPSSAPSRRRWAEFRRVRSPPCAVTASAR